MDIPLVMHSLDSVVYGAFIGAAVALPVLLVSWFSYMKKVRAARRADEDPHQVRIPRSFFAFGGFVGIALLGAWASTRIARDATLKELNTLQSNCVIEVAGRPAANPQRVLSVLKGLASVTGHHSYPIYSIPVTLRDASLDLSLVLSRDSSNSQEYWVFLPKYSVTARNEIGRVYTDAFDAQ